MESAFTPRKQWALQELGQQGYPVSGGLGYGLEDIADPGVTLEQVWQDLSTIKGSLARTVLAERDER